MRTLTNLDRLRPRRAALLDLDRVRDLRLTGLRDRVRRRLLERERVGLRRRRERERDRERDLLRLQHKQSQVSTDRGGNGKQLY